MTIVPKMKELYGRRVILMHERANFFRITQSDHQTLKQFANSLREAAGHCNLETFNTEAALVLQFINGMKNEEIKIRLLAKENIELDEALSFLEMYEEIYGCNSRSIMKECYAVQETRGIKPRGVSSCGKQGDLAKVCKHPQKLGKSEKQRPQNSWKDHKLYADGTYAVKERAHNFEVTVKINGSPKRKRATVMLRSFTGHEVNLKGETMVTVEGNEKAIVRVAKNGATNVMGQDWINACRAAETLRSLLANKKEVNAVESRTQNDVALNFQLCLKMAFGIVQSLSCPHRHGKKLNGKIPICADFSTGLNDRLMVDSYPTLRPEDFHQALRAAIPNVAAYLDDIILTGATDDEYRRTLKLVLGRLKEFGLRIRKEKYPKKRTAIVNMPLPKNIAKLRSFLRMYNYYTEFIPKLAEMCSPLNQLLRKDARWKWTGEHTKAVERVKRLLNSPLLLTHYHPEWLIVLAADASNKGIGAVVYHRLSDGTVKVIAHASKKLNAAERNYGQIEKEVLALVYGVKKLHKYLWGRRFTLLTDHKPLVSIFGSKKGVPQMAACRLTRWAIALMNYSFDIEYHSTKNFCQADCLSRLLSSSDELFDANFDHREAEDELTVKQLIVELQAELPVTA
ncbi:Transposon Tf2-9 polyprotein [Trichinella sp. T9]|nr:Transposon Tf2-9 polyprotein [Trichinella sp. T9]